MKSLFSTLRVLLVVSGLILGVASSGAAQPPAAKEKQTEKAAEKAQADSKAGEAAILSVFNTDPKAGRDPFFPKSTRREPKVVSTSPTSTKPAEKPVSVVDKLQIKGIIGDDLVLVNSEPIKVGESGTVHLTGLPAVKVKVLGIRRDEKGNPWVKLSVEGVQEAVELPYKY